MNISIVIAAYNEKKNVNRLLESISRLRGNSGDFEVCFVNDGSRDETGLVFEEWQNKHSNIKIVYKNLVQNVGRRKAREIGARLATYENLLITDARCELFPDVLERLEEINYEPLNGNPIQKSDGILARLFFLLRKKIFKGSVGESFEDIFIDEGNFNRVSKGTTVFFTNKERFLRSQPKEESKYVNEDTAVLSFMIGEKKILKTAKVRCFYNQRMGLFEEMRHLFHRGPRFVFYYYHPKHWHFYFINFSLAVFLTMLVFVACGFIWEMVGLFLLADVIFSLYFSERAKDFFQFLILSPLLGLSFFVGIIKGLFIKIFNKF